MKNKLIGNIEFGKEYTTSELVEILGIKKTTFSNYKDRYLSSFEYTEIRDNTGKFYTFNKLLVEEN